MEQIGETVKLLRVTCDLSAILDFAEKKEKRDKFLMANFDLHSYYQIK